jgi:hypothetical protein
MRISSELEIDEYNDEDDYIFFSFIFHFETEDYSSEVRIPDPRIIEKENWEEMYNAIQNEEYCYIEFSGGKIETDMCCINGKVIFSCWPSITGDEAKISVTISLSKYKLTLLTCIRSLLDDERISDLW